MRPQSVGLSHLQQPPLQESAMDQITTLTAEPAPSFARAFVGFLSSITVMTAAMVMLGSLGV
jgi:hypothetical protein